ncbi:MAG TPA: wax ester/triacylglycerol synthase domain-containing protein [Acidimicrobiia bacterium]|nr:wax ester/triacylglycerol synthase domain-containing protein [Acidimicrobiia bacterium]
MAGAGDFDLQMSDADALMWTVEKDPTLRSTVVTVLTFDRSPDWDALVERVDRGSHLIPRLRQRVVTPLLRVGPPCWSADPDFDLSYHLRRVRAPEPGSFDCVLDIARNAAMAGFDRARPLWEYTVVDGLEGGRSAFVIKVHHSMTDGVGGMKLLMMLFDLERDPGPPGPTDELHDLPAFTPLALVGQSLDYQRRRAWDIAQHALANTVNAARVAIRDPEAAAQEASRVTRSVVSFLAPATTPRSPIIGARSLARRLSALDIPLDDLKRAAKSVGSSLNDAFLAAVVGGIQRYHALHGVEPAELRMVMPINLRGEGAALGGNHFTPARFLVPLQIADPGERVRVLGDLARAVRDEPAVALTDVLASVLNQLPSRFTTAFFGAMLKGSDFVTSNVPGSPFPLYVAGAELERLYPFAPLSGTAANVALLSHCGTCCIGINTDSVAIPDAPEFAKCVEAGFAEVIALGA